MTDSIGFNPTVSILASGRTNIGGLFASTVATYGDEIAMVDGERTISFRALNQQANQWANAFESQGLSKGDRVAVLARNCLEYLVIELAAAKSGLIVAALNWRLSDPELAHCINLVSPALIVLQVEYAETVQRLDCEAIPVWSFDEELKSWIANQDKEFDLAEIDGEDGLVILYTSGTTGMPKGALISHRAMIARAAVFASDLNLPRRSNFVAWAPLFHMASTDHALATLMRGGTVFVVDGYQTEKLINILSNHTVGWFVLMPGMVGDFADACTKRQLQPKGVTVCGAMADLVPRHEIAAATRALQAPYSNSFGATETGLAPATASVIEIGSSPSNLSKTQSAFVELRLVDPEDRDVEQGEPGEVALRGPTLFSGYWNAIETNALDFRNGWFHMGDVMRRNSDGSLDYVDRVKYMIKSGGENIYPAEIEQVIARDPRVSEAIVVRRSDTRWGEVPVVFVIALDQALQAQDVLTGCDGHLARYKHPKDVFFISEDEVPRSTTGKIQRHELEKRLTGDQH